MLEGRICSQESQSHHPSDSLGSGGFSPAALPTNVVLGLLSFAIADGLLFTRKALCNQDHQPYLRGIAGIPLVSTALLLSL